MKMGEDGIEATKKMLAVCFESNIKIFVIAYLDFRDWTVRSAFHLMHGHQAICMLLWPLSLTMWIRMGSSVCYDLYLIIPDCNARFVTEELLIDFWELLGKHSGENIAKAVWETLVMYGIEGRVVILNATCQTTWNWFTHCNLFLNPCIHAWQHVEQWHVRWWYWMSCKKGWSTLQCFMGLATLYASYNSSSSDQGMLFNDFHICWFIIVLIYSSSRVLVLFQVQRARKLLHVLVTTKMLPQHHLTVTSTMMLQLKMMVKVTTQISQKTFCLQ